MPHEASGLGRFSTAHHPPQLPRAALLSAPRMSKNWKSKLFSSSRRGFHAKEFLRRAGRASRHLRPAAEQGVDVSAPKFFPFVPQTDVKQAFLEYRYCAAVRAGELLIRPLSQRQLGATTDLLTQSFSEAIGYFSVYRTFLRRHIQTYLTQHVHLPPKAIVLVALLRPPATSSGAAPAAGASNGSRPAPEQQQEADAAAGVQQRLQASAAKASNGNGAHAVPLSAASVHTNIEELMQRLTDNRLGMPGGLASTQEQEDSGDGEAEGAEAEQEASTSGRAGEDEGTVVGTVEISIAASSRTRFLTLNAPEECAYICNMAVAPEHRRKGYGLLLLEAAEEIARLGGQRDLYLHLRLKDAPAQALYERAGFTEVQKDNVLVLLLGQDRRFLMRKRLTPGLTPGSA